MSNPWQQVFESHRDAIDQTYIAEKYGQHKSDDQEETQALYDLRNKMKNMGKDAVVAYLKRSKMSPERKARLARALGVSVAEEFVGEGLAAQALRLGLMAGTAAAGVPIIQGAKGMRDKLNQIQQQKIKDIKQVDPNLKMSYEPEGDSLEEKITASTDIGTAIKHFRASTSPQLAGRSSDERRKAAIAAVLQARRDAEKTKKEEFELQEEAKILVRVTKEDGSVFQKKIPASALQDYRKRYKTVVVVGSAEGSSKGGNQPKSNVNEAEKKPVRWWDNDGDGIGYEKGEVSGSFKKKKKTRKEEYSDWRSENPDIAEATKAQKSVEGKAHASYEGEDKKKRKKNADESECGCSHEVKEAAELLAQELGAEFINITENVGRKILQTVLKTATKAVPAELKLGQTAPGAIVKYKPQVTAITKAKPEVTAITKPGTKQQTATKVDAKTGELVKVDVKTGQIVVADPKVKTQTKTKTLALPLTQTQTQTQTATPAPPAPPTTGKPPAPGPKAGKGTGRLPKVKPSPGLSDPVAPASTIKA